MGILKIIFTLLFLTLVGAMISFGFRHKKLSDEAKHIIAQRYIEKKTEAVPVITMASDTMEMCLKFLASKASSDEVEGQKQLLLKQRSTVPISCKEVFNTFLFFVDEIINEDVQALNKDYINDLHTALHNAFNDLIDTYASYLEDQHGYPNLEMVGKIDPD
jgi:hypothetical protein